MIGLADSWVPGVVGWVARERRAARYLRRERLGFQASQGSNEATSLPHLLVLLVDPVKQARVRGAVHQAAALRLGHWVVVEVSDEEALFRAARSVLPALVIIEAELPPRDALEVRNGFPGERMCAAFPSVPVLVYLDPDQTPADRVLEWGRCGIRGVVELGKTDRSSALAGLIARTSDSALEASPLEGVFGIVPPELHRLFRRAYLEAGSPTAPRISVDDLTRLWRPGAHRTTLNATLRRAGLPSPGWVARWIVAFRAVNMLANPGTTVGQVALTLGFESDAALREFLRRLAERPPTRLGPCDLIALFHRRCGRELIPTSEPRAPARIREVEPSFIPRSFGAHSLEEWGASALGVRHAHLPRTGVPAPGAGPRTEREVVSCAGNSSSPSLLHRCGVEPSQLRWPRATSPNATTK